MKEIFNKLLAMEVALQKHENRTNISQLKALIHPEFLEIGYSGKTHDYNSTLKNLLSENNSELIVWSQDFRCTKFAPTVIQITYKSALQDKKGNLSRHSKRSSIWVNMTEGWKILFHQGTPTDEF